MDLTEDIKAERCGKIMQSFKFLLIADNIGHEENSVGSDPPREIAVSYTHLDVYKRQVLIEAAAASVNPIDWKLRSGMRQKDFPLSFPAILGRDVSGVVRAVGANVKHFKACLLYTSRCV